MRNVLMATGLIMAFLAASGCYNGDGELKKDGFLLRSYSLALEIDDFERKGCHRFNIEGFGLLTTKTFVKMVIDNDRPYPFWKLDAHVGIRVLEESSGEIVWKKNLSPLNESFVRQRNMGFSHGLKESEWHALYQYSDTDFRKPNMYWIGDKEMRETKSMSYHAWSDMGDLVLDLGKKYVVNVCVKNGASALVNPKAKVVFFSTWK